MSRSIEFGYFGETGSDKARGTAFEPALRRALDNAGQSFSSLWFSDHFMYGDAEIHEAWVIQLCRRTGSRTADRASRRL